MPGVTWLSGWRAEGAVRIRVNADDNAEHARYDFILSGATSAALAQAISLTDLLRPCGASVPTQHVAPASPATEKAGIKAGMKRGCLAKHPMQSIG